MNVHEFETRLLALEERSASGPVIPHSADLWDHIARLEKGVANLTQLVQAMDKQHKAFMRPESLTPVIAKLKQQEVQNLRGLANGLAEGLTDCIVKSEKSTNARIDATLGSIATDTERLRAVVAQNAASAASLLTSASYHFCSGE